MIESIEMIEPNEMTEPNQMQNLSRKMGHDLADLLYLTKDDFFYAAQWQAAMKSLDDFVREYERVKNDN